MAKFLILAAIAAMVAVASAGLLGAPLVAPQILTSGGSKDILGNYYDATTGQISSSLTGHVFNTRGYLAAAPYLAAPYAAPIAAPYAAPYLGGYAAPYAAPLASPYGLLLKK